MTPSAPPKQYTAEELRSMHMEEASTLGWRCIFNAGEVKGDMNVSILPPPNYITHETRSRLYVYHRDAVTGLYFLARKLTV